jgi:hypothetical protein
MRSPWECGKKCIRIDFIGWLQIIRPNHKLWNGEAQKVWEKLDNEWNRSKFSSEIWQSWTSDENEIEIFSFSH